MSVALRRRCRRDDVLGMRHQLGQCYVRLGVHASALVGWRACWIEQQHEFGRCHRDVSGPRRGHLPSLYARVGRRTRVALRPLHIALETCGRVLGRQCPGGKIDVLVFVAYAASLRTGPPIVRLGSSFGAALAALSFGQSLCLSAWHYSVWFSVLVAPSRHSIGRRFWAPSCCWQGVYAGLSPAPLLVCLPAASSPEFLCHDGTPRAAIACAHDQTSGNSSALRVRCFRCARFLASNTHA